MNDLSLFLLDIVQNAIAVQATSIVARLEECFEDGMLLFEVADNGPGMTEEQAKQAVHPFYTTRTTRKVGLGLPFLDAAAKQANGRLTLVTSPGLGTTVSARFDPQSIDILPFGDIATSVFCIAIHPDVVDFTFRLKAKGHCFDFCVKDIKEALSPLSLQDPIAQNLLHTYLANNIPLFL